MSFNFMQWLEDAWNKTHKIDPLGHAAVEGMVKQGSRGAEHLGHFLGWDYLADEGKKNQENPVRGIARGSVAAAAGYGAAAAYPYLAGSGAAAKTGAGLAASEALGNSGMFAASEGTQQALLQEAIQEELKRKAAEEALKAGAGGMFAQVPGAGAAQTAALNAQTDIFGGAGSDLTAQSAMPAVRDAYRAGNMGTMDYLSNIGKADMAGMNDPSVWLDRLGKNASRLAGNYGRNAAMNALTPKPSSYQPVSMPRQQQMPQQQPGGEDIQQAIADFKSGKISEDELRRRIQALGVRA